MDMLGVSRRMTVMVDGARATCSASSQLNVDAMIAHLDHDEDGALSLNEFSLGVRTYPALVELFARYQDQEMIQLKRATQGIDIEIGQDPYNSKKEIDDKHCCCTVC